MTQNTGTTTVPKKFSWSLFKTKQKVFLKIQFKTFKKSFKITKKNNYRQAKIIKKIRRKFGKKTLEFGKFCDHWSVVSGTPSYSQMI